MKAYITDLVGDENPIDIDCSILQCMLQEAIFEKLINAPTNTIPMEYVEGAIYNVLRPYIVMPRVSIDLTLKRGDDEWKTYHTYQYQD